MASEERAQPEITSLPRVEDLPIAEQGYDADRVRDAFDAFRRHVVQLQAQLRVLQAAGQTANVEPTGHAVRMDALHLIREAAAFADVLENDAQRASAAQFGKTEQEVRRRQSELGPARDGDRALPAGERAPAGRDRQRGPQRGSPAARRCEPTGDPGAPRGRGPRRQAARAVAPSGDRAHELGTRRGGADAGVGARPGERDHGPCAAGRRAAALRGGARRRGDLGRFRSDRPGGAGRHGDRGSGGDARASGPCRGGTGAGDATRARLSKTKTKTAPRRSSLSRQCREDLGRGSRSKPAS